MYRRVVVEKFNVCFSVACFEAKNVTYAIKTREYKNHTLFHTKMVKIDTPFQPKTAKNPIPAGAALTYIAHIWEYPTPRDYCKANRSLVDSNNCTLSNCILDVRVKKLHTISTVRYHDHSLPYVSFWLPPSSLTSWSPSFMATCADSNFCKCGLQPWHYVRP